ncbi:MAG: basic amino acid ABC transporter substrate-binding protein [Anaerolineales bacterium]|nr:basic amino acid ABC transporter substrate-binding protein [Anaerolineales bacterium]
MKRWIVALLCGLFLVSCSPAKVKVVVATDATWPPFEYVDEASKEIIGFDIDLMKAIAEKEGMEVEFVNVAWDALLAGVAQCQYDVAISSVSITEERKVNMLFSDPYYTVGQQIVVAADNADITGEANLSGKRVGAQISTTGAELISGIEGAELVNFNTVGLAFQALMNGDVDAVVADNVMALGYVAKYSGQLKAVGEPLTGESIGIAVCKTKTDLLAKINSGLAKVKAEGLIDELNEKWVKTLDLGE